VKILISGICGFVGSVLARTLLECSWVDEVIGIDNFCRPGSELNRRKLANLGVRVIAGDIRNASDIDSLPKVDWVLDAAASPSVLAGVDGKTSSRQLVEHNLGGTVNILEYCRAHSAGFVLLSTSRVYSIEPLTQLKLVSTDDAFQLASDQQQPSGVSSAGVSELFSTAPPVSLYGCTKLTSEYLALEYASTFEFPVWINRCGVMSGAGQFGHPAQGIFAFWVHSFRENAPLKYIGFEGSGHQVRDCLHPKDLVSLLQKQIHSQPSNDIPRIVNVGGGIESRMSLAQLTRWCVHRFPKSRSIEGLQRIVSSSGSVPETAKPAMTETRRFDIPWMVLDAGLCKKTWGWTAETKVQSICEEIAEHADANPQWLALSKQ
jgi:CDP-paratose 2-epimerase